MIQLSLLSNKAKKVNSSTTAELDEEENNREDSKTSFSLWNEKYPMFLTFAVLQHIKTTIIFLKNKFKKITEKGKLFENCF